MHARATSEPGRVRDGRGRVPRILISFGLVLLMIVGIWTATHTETAAGHPTSSSVTDLAGSLDTAAAVVLPAEPMSNAAAICILGILCTIVLALAGWFRTRRAARDVGFRMPRPPLAQSRPLSAQVRTPAPLDMGISRT